MESKSTILAIQRETIVLFEPWALGDALIAAHSAARLPSSTTVLACASRFAPILKTTYPQLTLQSVDLIYTQKIKKGWVNQLKKLQAIKPYSEGKVISIRGDIRDFVACGRLFPSLQRDFTGWEGFLARRSNLLDWPFRNRMIPVQNRYDRWAKRLGLSAPIIGNALLPTFNSTRPLRITLHIGSQWQSKQYPYLSQLIELLESKDYPVRLICGPGDTIPLELKSKTLPVVGLDLIQELRDCDLFIGHDSGPMHLSAALGRPTVALVGLTGAQEWMPHGVLALSRHQKIGYRPLGNYAQDQLILDPKIWLSPEEIAHLLKKTGMIDR